MLEVIGSCAIWLLDLSALVGLWFWCRIAWAFRGVYRPRFIEDVEPSESTPGGLTVVVPARNEAASIESTVRSLLSQSVRRLQLIVIDDRSTDSTGAIVERIARDDPRLLALHLTEIPPDWMGKAYAMEQGLAAATGEWVLFTDADVRFEPDTLNRAISHAQANQLDHLVVLPHYELYTPAEQAVMAFYALLYGAGQDLGSVRKPTGRGHVGIGQFNMVRRSVLGAIGGLKEIKLAIAEDVALGRAVKRAGYSQDFLCSRSGVSIRWQAGVIGIMGVLTRNAFARDDFNVGRILRRVALLAAANSIAPLAVFSPHLWARTAAWAMVLLAIGGYATVRPFIGGPRWLAVFHPITACAVLVALCRSAIQGHRLQGVMWRDCFYPKSVVRAFQREQDLRYRWKGSPSIGSQSR